MLFLPVQMGCMEKGSKKWQFICCCCLEEER